jgi:hypothetical protein
VYEFIRWMLFRRIGDRWYARPVGRLEAPRYRAYHLQRLSKRKSHRHVAFYRTVPGPIAGDLPTHCETCGEPLTVKQLDLSDILALEPVYRYPTSERRRYHSAKGCPIIELVDDARIGQTVSIKSRQHASTNKKD